MSNINVTSDFDHSSFLKPKSGIINKKTNINSDFVKQVEKYYISETCKLSIATGPLYYISAQLQYLNHNKNISRPFKICSFSKVYDLLKHTYYQGFLAFYKGNLSRLSFFIGTVQTKKYIELNFDDKIFIKNKIAREIILFSLVDMIFNPFLFIETRLVMQNRNNGFRIYNGILDILMKCKTDVFSYSIINVYRNILFVLAVNTFFIAPSKVMNFTSVLLSHILSYPLLTIQRNLYLIENKKTYFEFSSENKSFFKIREIVNIIKSHKITGLYKGFSFYIFSIGLWHYYVPSAAKHKYYQNLL